MIEHLMRRRGNGKPETNQAEADDATRELHQDPASPDAAPDPKLSPAENVWVDAESILERVASMSLNKIDSLIGELEQLRDLVNEEGLHIQRDIDGYARLSDEVTGSIKILLESVSRLKDAITSETRLAGL